MFFSIRLIISPCSERAVQVDRDAGGICSTQPQITEDIPGRKRCTDKDTGEDHI